jgi:hypothetical protein
MVAHPGRNLSDENLKWLVLVARTGIEPVVSALRGRRVKPITLPGHCRQFIVKRTFQQSKSRLGSGVIWQMTPVPTVAGLYWPAIINPGSNPVSLPRLPLRSITRGTGSHGDHPSSSLTEVRAFPNILTRFRSAQVCWRTSGCIPK